MGGSSHFLEGHSKNKANSKDSADSSQPPKAAFATAACGAVLVLP
jgi:hypothetical protein